MKKLYIKNPKKVAIKHQNVNQIVFFGFPKEKNL